MKRLLVAAVAVVALVPCEPASAANVVSAECHFSVSGLPTSTNVLVSIQATATASGSPDVQLTSVRCEVRNVYGESVVAETVLPGPRVVIVAEGILRSSSLSCELTAEARWILTGGTATDSGCLP